MLHLEEFIENTIDLALYGNRNVQFDFFFFFNRLANAVVWFYCGVIRLSVDVTNHLFLVVSRC